MSKFWMILCATTLSGSVLPFMVVLFDKMLTGRIQMKQLYLFMKVSLLYFLLPGVFVVATMANVYTYQVAAVEFSEISHMTVYSDMNSLIAERILPKLFVVKGLFLVWLTGMAAFLAMKGVYRGHNLHMLQKTYTLVNEEAVLRILKEVAKEYKVRRTVLLYRSPVVSSPFLTGIIKLRLVLPDMALSDEELEIVFRHELTHCKSNDILFRSLIGLAQGMNWFNPFIWRFSEVFYNYGELACDEKVSGQLPDSQKPVYAHLLIKLVEHSRTHPHIAMFSNDSEYFMKRRIRIIMEKAKIKKAAVLSALAFCMVILSCPLVAFASSASASRLGTEIIQIVDRNIWKKEPYTPFKYEEYQSRMANRRIDLVVNPVVKGSNLYNFIISEGDMATTDAITASAGKRVKVTMSCDSASGTFTVSLVDESGGSRSVDSHNGSVDYLFDITESGTYSVTFENTCDQEIHISGTVYVNY